MARSDVTITLGLVELREQIINDLFKEGEPLPRLFEGVIDLLDHVDRYEALGGETQLGSDPHPIARYDAWGEVLRCREALREFYSGSGR